MAGWGFGAWGEGAWGITNYGVTATTGSYTVTGRAAAVLRAKVLPAGNGSYTVEGQNNIFLHGRVLVATSGEYAITGQDANVQRRLFWEPVADAQTASWRIVDTANA